MTTKPLQPPAHDLTTTIERAKTNDSLGASYITSNEVYDILYEARSGGITSEDIAEMEELLSRPSWMTDALASQSRPADGHGRLTDEAFQALTEVLATLRSAKRF
jgi:hypothetical protein